ncbi:hypothetical protein ACFPM0_23740 [Pseudonocardia sulfidoxydans]|uniref:hypothetical protein n=1 Tax=Pseudonocardia sulfidoxydans TaxID=54011 RepID=UPI00360B81C2
MRRSGVRLPKAAPLSQVRRLLEGFIPLWRDRRSAGRGTYSSSAQVAPRPADGSGRTPRRFQLIAGRHRAWHREVRADELRGTRA